MSDVKTISVGSVLEWRCPVYAHNVHRWVVRGVHLGALGTESLIEIESITHRPGWTGEWETHQTMFVPEVLVRELPIVSKRRVGAGADL